MVNLTRRGLFGAFVGGAVFSFSGEALAALPDKYRKLVEMQQRLDAEWAALKPEFSVLPLEGKIAYRKNFTKQCDAVVSYAQENFPVKLEGREEYLRERIRHLFGLEEDGRIELIDVLDENELRETENEVIQIAILKRMMTEKYPLVTAQMPSFDKFTKELSPFILPA